MITTGSAMRIAAHRVSRAASSSSPLRRAPPCLNRRCYSSVAPSTLPLQGYRVLDMTRVLAGVCVPSIFVFLGLYINPKMDMSGSCC